MRHLANYGLHPAAGGTREVIEAGIGIEYVCCDKACVYGIKALRTGIVAGEGAASDIGGERAYRDDVKCDLRVDGCGIVQLPVS